jgi:acyl-CoA thioesterase
MNIIPINRKLRQYIPAGGPNLRWNDRLGPGYREEWIKMDDESGFDVRILGKLCDPFLSMPTTYPPDPNEAMKNLMAFVYPTISMTTEIRRDPKGAGWLFVKIRSQKVENGRYSVDITILDEEGDLVALSRNMGLMIAVPGGLKVVGSAEKL